VELGLVDQLNRVITDPRSQHDGALGGILLVEFWGQSPLGIGGNLVSTLGFSYLQPELLV